MISASKSCLLSCTDILELEVKASLSFSKLFLLSVSQQQNEMRIFTRIVNCCYDRSDNPLALCLRQHCWRFVEVFGTWVLEIYWVSPLAPHLHGFCFEFLLELQHWWTMWKPDKYFTLLSCFWPEYFFTLTNGVSVQSFISAIRIGRIFCVCDNF